MSSTTITGISSMATKAVLAELAAVCERELGVALAIESVGGVDAARRVQAGEAFDLVILASDAIDKLIAAGRVVAGSRVDLVRSGVAVAVASGAPRPEIGSEEALRRAVQSARSIGYSTGPSGVALARLFETWGLADEIRERIVQAPPGVPVGHLVAQGQVELGFQQLSELMHLPGIDVLGPMPEPVQVQTIFAAGLCSASTRPDTARRVIDVLAAPAAAEVKRRHGMEPA